ncbi:uncharacterized protein LOC128712430 [Anopheles marshallii]|uniref:uncharacterized protein LOC128712430 n=1 Tax=Anopheles marshallii TaxID=1521116 RepID=UPI00237AF860|nr:uncharacterized protein LOC128712430 [Anopheles marshallii]
MKNDNKNANLTDLDTKQSQSEIPAAHTKPRDEELVLGKETSSKEIVELEQSENKVPPMDIIPETEQMDLTIKSPPGKIPIETALHDLHTIDVNSNQTSSKMAMPEESPINSDQPKDVSEDVHTIVNSEHEIPYEDSIPTTPAEILQDHSNSIPTTPAETLQDHSNSIPTTPDETLQDHSNSIPTTPAETLQDHSNLREFYTMAHPATKMQISDPKESNVEAIVKRNMLRKKNQSSTMSLKDRQQSSNKSSQSSLYSSCPSTSSLCHLTELAQPKPAALHNTLLRLRQLHGKDAEHLANIERHLRGLRSGPKRRSDERTNATAANNATTRKRTSKSARTQTKPSIAVDERTLGERESLALDKFASNLFTKLEAKRVLENYEVSRLQMPAEIGYYRAAYDALVTTFGQPYHKCTLELYQQLAGELGIQAEMFVIDKTPAITKAQ